MTMLRSPVNRALGILGLLALTTSLFGQTSGTTNRDNLDLRFQNGIVAVAEGKIITVDDIRREIAPMIPELQKSSRNEQEFNQRLEALQDDTIQALVDRVLIVKDFFSDEKRRIPASYVDNAVDENIINEFEGDRSKFLSYLRSRGLTLREYRRASAAAIDASLKPLMSRYIGDLSKRLGDLGFNGAVQILTSFGGVKMADEVAQAPIQLLQSGPSMAPVAGRFYTADDPGGDLIITDAGGTTYDVSLVREQDIIKTREYWIGEKFFGHVTGFPSVDVRSIGAGGGSIDVFGKGYLGITELRH